MRVLGWHIDACGHLRDVGVTDLDPGLTVITGRNESGKSTTHYFLRGVLFGWPAANSRIAQRYRPDGSSLGGRVAMLHDGRHLTLERTARTVRLVDLDGSECTDLAIDALLGGATRELYEAVFAVSATDLRFDGLDSDAVREKVFAAGITGGRRSARAAMAELDDRRSTLLKPRSGPIRDRLRALAALESELELARQRATELPALRRQVEAAHAAVEAAADHDSALRARAQHLDRLLDHWSSHGAPLESVRHQLAELPVLDLGPDPVGDLRREQQAETSARQALADHDRRTAGLRADREQIRLDERLVDHRERIERLANEVGRVAERRRHRTAEASRLERRRSQLVERCGQLLGPGAELMHLRAIDLSVVGRQRLDHAGGEVDGARRRAAEAAERLATAEAELARCVVVPPPDPGVLGLPAGTDPDRARDDLSWLRGALAELAVARATAAAEDRIARERVALLPPRSPTGTVPRWLVMVLGAFGLGAATIAGVSALGDEVTMAALWGAVAAVLILAAVVTHRTAAGPSQTAPLPVEHATGATPHVSAMGVEAAQADVHGDRATPADDHGPAAREAQRMAREVATVAARCGLGPEPRPDEVDRRLASLDDHQRQLDAHHRSVVARDDAAAAMDQATAAAERTAEELADAEATWVELVGALGLPAGLSPEQTLQVLSQLAQLVADHTEQVEAEATLDEADARLAEDTAAQVALLTDLGWGDEPLELPGERWRVAGDATELDDEDRAEAILQLHRRAGEDAEARQRLAELDDQLHDAEAQRRQLEEDIDRTAAAVQRRLEHAGATDATSFAAVAGMVQRRAALVAQVERAETALRATFGTGTPLETARAELTAADPVAWQREREGLDVQIAEAAEAHRAAVRHCHDEEQHLAEVQRSAAVATLDAEAASQRAELEAELREWTVLTVARTAIDRTLATFERDRQPEVLRRAAAIFGAASDGRWSELRARDGDISVVAPGGVELASGTLSTGTVDQLYLAMRLALAASHAEQSVALPMLLDDVLVNADDTRARTIAGELATVADQLQLVVFTASERTTEYLTDARPTATVIDLVNGAGAIRAEPQRR